MGALPRSRPGIRSPRRAQRPDADSARPKSGPAARGRSSRGESGAGLEEVVRTGASVASEAAGLGAQLAGRAANAIREALGRR
jgi:hypothetical protein